MAFVVLGIKSYYIPAKWKLNLEANAMCTLPSRAKCAMVAHRPRSTVPYCWSEIARPKSAVEESRGLYILCIYGVIASRVKAFPCLRLSRRSKFESAGGNALPKFSRLCCFSLGVAVTRKITLRVDLDFPKRGFGRLGMDLACWPALIVVTRHRNAVMLILVLLHTSRNSLQTFSRYLPS